MVGDSNFYVKLYNKYVRLYVNCQKLSEFPNRALCSAFHTWEVTHTFGHNPKPRLLLEYPGIPVLVRLAVLLFIFLITFILWRLGCNRYSFQGLPMKVIQIRNYFMLDYNENYRMLLWYMFNHIPQWCC